MEQTFKTTIRNEREKEPVALYERNGSTLALLMPGQERVLESWNPETIYARWISVVFVEGGEVQLTENSDWPRPEGRWLLTAINVEGRSCETRIIGGKEIVMPRGIPRLCAVELGDPLSGYSRLEIRQVMERADHGWFAGYSVKRMVVKDVLVDRPQEELEELEHEIKELLEANA